MGRAIIIAILAAVFVLPCRPQSFEVATIKPDRRPLPATAAAGPAGLPPPPPPPPAVRPGPAGLTILGATLKYCLQWAYDFRSWQISGPDWITVERFDITARTDTPADTARLKLMLRALLQDRFRMSLQREKKEARVMGIVRGSSEPKLTPSAPGGTLSSRVEFIGNGAFRFIYKNAGISVLEGPLSLPHWDPVIDMTELTGVYDFTFERPGRDAENPESWSGEIQAALQKQLGLRLRPTRAPVEFLIIERADRRPVEN